MAVFTEQSKVNKIEIVGDYKQAQIRVANEVLKDGVVISSTYHRYVLNPGADITAEPQEIQDICNVAWTPAVITAWDAKVAADAAAAV